MTNGRVKGDLFVGNNVYANGEELATSTALTDGLALKADKSAGYQYHSTVSFTSSGTFTKATYPWLRAIRVRVQGAGGGGGGAEAVGAGESAEGAGGGGGGYGEKFVTDIAGLSASETITVGSGGAGATGDATNVGATGGASTALGVSGLGGTGGSGCNASSAMIFCTRGEGSGATGADFVARGDDGAMGASYGYGYTSMQNNGGGSFLAGVRNTGASSNVDGSNGYEYGGGASGGRNRGQNSAAKTGGNGGDGIVILELYA